MDIDADLQIKHLIGHTEPLILWSDEVPFTIRVNFFSFPSSSKKTAVTDADREIGWPMEAPWIRSLSRFTRKLDVFSPITKEMASMKLDFPVTYKLSS